MEQTHLNFEIIIKIAFMMMKYSNCNNQCRVFKKRPSVDRTDTSQGTGRSKKYKSRKASLDTVGSPNSKPYAAERIHVSFEFTFRRQGDRSTGASPPPRGSLRITIRIYKLH